MCNDTAKIHNKLMDLFIMRDFMACNRWLPIDPRRQAMSDYQSDPIIQGRVNEIVGDVLEIMEDSDGSLYTEKS